MKNSVLVKGRCALCNQLIDKEWSDYPSFGTVCRNCSDRRDTVFGPDHVEIQAEKVVNFEPLFGINDYVFNWRGTSLKVNGHVATVYDTQGDGSRVRFEGDTDPLGSFIANLGYRRLHTIYKQTGGEVRPPQFNQTYRPVRCHLLDAPILPISVEVDRLRGNYVIQVGNKSVRGGMLGAQAELPVLPTLHAFTNVFVRYKFGLTSNYLCEGGFMGDGFCATNLGILHGGVGLRVEVRKSASALTELSSAEELKHFAVVNGLMGLIQKHEQSRPGVDKDASVQHVLATWVGIMHTLLLFDWSKFDMKSVENTWEQYCRMQDVLLNVMSEEELKNVLEYARGAQLKHYGSSY